MNSLILAGLLCPSRLTSLGWHTAQHDGVAKKGLRVGLPLIRLLNQLKKLAGEFFILGNEIERILDVLHIVKTLFVLSVKSSTAPVAESVAAWVLDTTVRTRR